jgi:hypothetical protein
MKRNVRIAVFVGLGILVVAVAAFAAGRLFNQGPAGVFGPLGFMAGGPGKGGVFQSSVRLNLTPAKELPVEEPALRGLLARREDDKLFVGQGKAGMMVAVSKGDSGEAQLSGPEIEGPLTEVVVTHDTIIYRDDTFADQSKFELGEEVTVDQKVVIGTLDELGENSSVIVWGKKVGDRIVADVLLYSSMMVFRNAAGK